MIDEQRTLEIYGYTSDELKPHSHKPIVAVCEECGKYRDVPKDGYRELCKSCIRKGVPNIGRSAKGVPKSPEHCAAISKGLVGNTYRLGKSHSSLTRLKMSESALNSEAAKVNWENMRGGNDIVGHHVAYDFLRPAELKVWITRTFHGLIHNPKGLKFGNYGYSLID